jgi:hypothetical protein
MSSVSAFITVNPVETKLLRDLKIGFLIDNSGSTDTALVGNYRYIDVEKNFVKSWLEHLSQPYVIIEWNSQCRQITDINTIQPDGGTSPSCLFTTPQTKNLLKDLDAIVFLTDGQIGIRDVNSFAKEMLKDGIHFKMIIGVVVKRRSNGTGYTSAPAVRPADIDISVLAPALISNSCILMHNSNTSFVMWSSGSIQSQLNPCVIEDSTTWEQLTTVTVAGLLNLRVPIEDPVAIPRNYIPLGSGLYFSPDIFLQSSPTWDEMLTYPFDRICHIFKIINGYDNVLAWLNGQKDRFLREFGLDAQEENQVQQIIDRGIGPTRFRRNTLELSQYITSRNRFLVNRDTQMEDAEALVENPRARQLVGFFRRLFEVMQEDQEMLNQTNQHNQTSFTTGAYSSSRYSILAPAGSIPATGSAYSRAVTGPPTTFSDPMRWFRKFSAANPDQVATFTKCECSICCEDSVPFVLVRKHFNPQTINNVATNPGEYFYPGILCDKCATFFCKKGKDAFRVDCYAAIPLIRLATPEIQSDYVEKFGALLSAATSDSETKQVLSLILGLIRKRFTEPQVGETIVKMVFDLTNIQLPSSQNNLTNSIYRLGSGIYNGFANTLSRSGSVANSVLGRNSGGN